MLARRLLAGTNSRASRPLSNTTHRHSLQLVLQKAEIPLGRMQSALWISGHVDNNNAFMLTRMCLRKIRGNALTFLNVLIYEDGCTGLDCNSRALVV